MWTWPYALPVELRYLVLFTLCDIYIYIQREREKERERVCVCMCEWERQMFLCIKIPAYETFTFLYHNWVLVSLISVLVSPAMILQGPMTQCSSWELLVCVALLYEHCILLFILYSSSLSPASSFFPPALQSFLMNVLMTCSPTSLFFVSSFHCDWNVQLLSHPLTLIIYFPDPTTPLLSHPLTLIIYFSDRTTPFFLMLSVTSPHAGSVGSVAENDVPVPRVSQVRVHWSL